MTMDEEESEFQKIHQERFLNKLINREYPDPKNTRALESFTNGILAYLYAGDIDFEAQELLMKVLEEQPSLVSETMLQLELSQFQLKSQIMHLKSLASSLSVKEQHLANIEEKLNNILHSLITKIASEKNASSKPYLVSGGRKFTATYTPGSVVLNPIEKVPENFLKLEQLSDVIIKDGKVFKTSVDKTGVGKYLRTLTQEKTPWATLNRKKKVTVS